MGCRILEIEELEKLAGKADFQPAKMAELWPISLRQMERVFAHQFGKTPEQWTRELRCRLAKEQISRGWTNKAVADEFKFASQAHLCHEFQALYGASPRSFSPRHGNRQR